MKIEEFVGKYFHDKDLQDICEREGLSSSGTKEDLIRRLIHNGGYSIQDFIEWMSLEDLKDICRSLDLPLNGTRDDLVDRIMDKYFGIWGEY